MSVAVVVPFAGDGRRARNWRWLADRYAALHPTWRVSVGNCSGWWSKGRAIADGVARTSAELLVLADADCFVAPEVLDAAVELAREAPWVQPHEYVYRLSERTSIAVLEGPFDVAPPTRKLMHPPRRGVPGGGLVVLRRDAYETVGGVDPRFVGWGLEDHAFGWALDTLVGPHLRIGAPLGHLWHPPASPKREPRAESHDLMVRYRHARGDVVDMRALVEEHTMARTP